MKILLKVLRIFAIIVVSIVLLNIILFISLSIPYVQNKAKDFALDKIKPIINTEATIGNINLQLLNSVRLRNLYVEDQNQDTLLFAGRLDVRFNPFGLLRNKLQFYTVNLQDFTANIYKETPDTTFNFQFIIDAFASKDTTTKEPNPNPMVIKFDNVKLKNGIAHYNIQSEPTTPNMFNASHINVYDLNASIKAPSIDTKNLDATIRKLTLKERSGLVLHHLQSSRVTSKDSRLTASKLAIKINTTEIDAADIVYHLETQEFAIEVKSNNIAPADIAMFSPQFSHLNKPLVLDARLKGQLPQVDVLGLLVEYGTTTKIDLVGHIEDYTRYDNADVAIDLQQLRTTQSDLAAFMKIGSDSTVLPHQVRALGNLNLKLTAKGTLKRLNIDGLIKTSPGNVRITGRGAVSQPFTDFAFNGRIVTNNLNTALILGEGVGLDLVSADINTTVKQSKDKPISVAADGIISSLIYNDYSYSNINFNGSYTDSNIEAEISTDTPTDKFSLQAKMLNAAGMDISVDGTIDRLVLKPFYAPEEWTNASITARIEGAFTGTSIDDMVGNLVLDSTSLVEETFIFNPGAIYLQSEVEEGEKTIRLFSNFLEAEIKGNYYFTTIAQELKQLMQPHLPTLLDTPSATAVDYKNDFRFDLTLKNTEDLSYAFSLPFYNVETGTIVGQVDMPNRESTINLTVPRLMFGANDVRQTKVDINIAQTSGLDLDAITYLVQDDGYINGKLNTQVFRDSVTNALFFDMNNNVISSNGELRASIGFDRDQDQALATNIMIHPTTLRFNKKDVNIIESSIQYTSEFIKVSNFGIIHEGKQQFGIDGIASKNAEDSVRVFFDDAELANILTAFNVKNISGTIDGNLIVHQALKDPILHTDHFNILDIRTDKDTIGTLFVEALYNPLDDGLKLDVYINKNGQRHTGITGFVPSSADKDMDLDVVIEQFPLRWIQPFATETFSKLEGTMSTKIDIAGKTSAPIIEGWLGINEGLLKVDFTNVEYRISDTIRVNRDNVGFKDLVITDENGNTARVGLVLNHSDNFGRLEYKANVALDDFMLLNNADRTDLMAHGVLKLDGDITLNGSPTGLFGTANISSSSKSKVKIELPQTASASEYKGIIYINTPQDNDPLSFIKNRGKASSNKASSSASSGMMIDIQATVNLTPLLELGVQYNPRTGDEVSISGRGELMVNYNTKSDPQIRIYGEYIAQDGEASHNLQGLKKIHFKVKEGSKINFMGDPLQTKFNLTAYHQVKADLATLSESFSYDTNVSNTRVPVNALLQISGDLDGMEIYYDIELPEASQDVQRKVQSLINTEETRIRQFAYLVATNSFYGASSSPDSGFGNDMFTNIAASALTKGLDALFASALSDNWSISTNLKSQNGSFEDVRMGVDVSTRLLNDKLEVSTNLSYGDNQMYKDQESFIAEFDARYEIFNWLRLRAYNKANERYYKLAPTTQGVGAEVNKEGKTFKDLFRFPFIQRKRKPAVTSDRTSSIAK